MSPRVQLVRPNAAHARRRFSIGNDGALRNLEISDQLLQLSQMAGRRLPAGRRVSRNGWQRSFPDEGCGSLCCISLFAKAGRRESVTFRQALMTELWALGTASAACSSFFSEVSLQDSAQFVGEACNRVYF